MPSHKSETVACSMSLSPASSSSTLWRVEAVFVFGGLAASKEEGALIL